MHTSFLSYLWHAVKKKKNKYYLSKRELEEYMRIEGVSYVDLFPPLGDVSKHKEKP